MVTDDRDQAGDDGADSARPDTQAPEQLRPAVGVALGRFDDAEREGDHEQDDACDAQPCEGDRPPATPACGDDCSNAWSYLESPPGLAETRPCARGVIGSRFG